MFKDRSSKRLAVTDTLIGQGTVLEGKLECEAGIRIEGEFRGEIACKGDVTIGESGIARSTIEARDVTIAGKVFGEVKTNGRLTVTASGELHGNVEANTMVIQDGAVLNGLCLMEKTETRLETKANKPKEQRASASPSHEHKDTKEKAKQAG